MADELLNSVKQLEFDNQQKLLAGIQQSTAATITETRIIDASESSSGAITVKKGRGRPTSKKSIASAAVKGVVTTCFDQANLVEIVSNQPSIFKKMPEILKTFNVLRLWIKIHSGGMEISFMDHLRHSRNKLLLPANSMVSHYLSADAAVAWLSSVPDGELPKSIYLCCSREHLMEICKDIGDLFKELRIIVRRDPKKWYISIQTDTGSTEINEVPARKQCRIRRRQIRRNTRPKIIIIIKIPNIR